MTPVEVPAGPNPNADPAYIIIIMPLPDTVGHAVWLISVLKHRQGDISRKYDAQALLKCYDDFVFLLFLSSAWVE